MKFPQVIMFCCFLVVCVEASEVLEVSGRVGGDVSIHCSGNWTTNNSSSSSEHSSVYFCKGACSSENILIQTERERSSVAQRGRYSMQVGRRDFNVMIKNLKRADAGRYHCGGDKTFNVLYQEVNLIVLEAPSVPPGSPPSTTTTLQTEAETLPHSSSSPEPSPTALTPPPSEEKRNQRHASKLTDTTVVIIVSVSLALLVCAIIPLIFYRHWQSNAEGAERNKSERDYCEGNASTQVAVGLQTFEPESSAQDTVQYTAIYQALDPKTLD